MKKYRVAITGYGARGQHHIYGFNQVADRFEIVGLCDISPEKREEARRNLPESVRIFDSTDEMLAETQPDVFSFCAMPNLRLPMFELAVKHGVKAVAYEKPMATSLQEARAIRDLCRHEGIKALVSHQMKYGSHFKAVKEIVSSGRLGRIHTIHATSKGWMLQFATHLMDYMMHFNGVVGAEWVCGHVNGRTLLDDTHPSPEYMLGVVYFKNGVEGIIETGLISPDVPDEEHFWFNSKIAVYGELGYAEVREGLGWRAVIAGEGVLEGPGCWDPGLDQPPYMRDLADWLDDDSKVHPCNNEDSYVGFEIAMGIAESALTHKRIDLPFEPEGDIIERMRRLLPDQERKGTWPWD